MHVCLFYDHPALNANKYLELRESNTYRLLYTYVYKTQAERLSAAIKIQQICQYYNWILERIVDISDLRIYDRY